MRRQVGEVAGMRLPDVERAHWSTFVWVQLDDLPADVPLAGDVIEGAAARLEGAVLLRIDGLAFVEFRDPVAAIDFALEIVPPFDGGGVLATAGIHVGRVKPRERPLCSHASQVAAAALDLAESGATLVTGAVLVELGDAAFDRYARVGAGSAELDGEVMSLYGFSPRPAPASGDAPTPTA